MSDKEENSNEKEKPKTSIKSTKNILVGIGISIFTAVLIGAFSLLMSNMKHELRETLITSFEDEIKPIKKALEVEKEKRIELVANLMKQKPLNIPTDLLTQYEEIEKNPELLNKFKSALKKNLPRLADNELKSVQDEIVNDKGKTAVIAPLSENKDQFIVALASFDIDSVSGFTNNKLFDIALTDNPMNIFNSKHVETGNVWVANRQEINPIFEAKKTGAKASVFFTREKGLINQDDVLQEFNPSEFNTESVDLTKIIENTTSLKVKITNMGFTCSNGVIKPLKKEAQYQ
ncbi:MAG: hypothetical protein AAF611_07965 [Bacteroidota bacterium]